MVDAGMILGVAVKLAAVVSCENNVTAHISTSVVITGCKLIVVCCVTVFSIILPPSVIKD